MQLTELARAEEDVKRAIAHLEILRARAEADERALVAANREGLIMRTPDTNLAHFLLRGCGRFLVDRMRAAEQVLLMPPIPAPQAHGNTTSPARLGWGEALSKFLGNVCSNATCGLISMPAQIDAKAKDVSGRKQATASSQHEVLPSLQSCLCGTSDVDLALMAKGVRPMILALEVLGSWTIVAVREIKSNLEKVEKSAAVSSMAAGTPRLLSTVLQAELSAGIHGAGGIVAHGSAAEGCLWLLRFLTLWREIWREPRPHTFKDAISTAYAKSIREYHSWLVQVRLAALQHAPAAASHAQLSCKSDLCAEHIQCSNRCGTELGAGQRRA